MCSRMYQEKVFGNAALSRRVELGFLGWVLYPLPKILTFGNINIT